MNTAKPFTIPKRLVYEAFKAVKYRRPRRHKTRASLFLERVAEEQPYLFVHWQEPDGGRVSLMGAV